LVLFLQALRGQEIHLWGQLGCTPIATVPKFIIKMKDLAYRGKTVGLKDVEEVLVALHKENREQQGLLVTSENVKPVPNTSKNYLALAAALLQQDN
jgi:hypothetical protein